MCLPSIYFLGPHFHRNSAVPNDQVGLNETESIDNSLVVLRLDTTSNCSTAWHVVDFSDGTKQNSNTASKTQSSSTCSVSLSLHVDCSSAHLGRHNSAVTS